MWGIWNIYEFDRMVPEELRNLVETGPGGKDNQNAGKGTGQRVGITRIRLPPAQLPPKLTVLLYTLFYYFTLRRMLCNWIIFIHCQENLSGVRECAFVAKLPFLSGFFLCFNHLPSSLLPFCCQMSISVQTHSHNQLFLSSKTEFNKIFNSENIVFSRFNKAIWVDLIAQ